MKRLILVAFLVLFTVIVAFSNEDKRLQDNYFSVSTGCGATIPLGDLSPAFNIAITPVAAFDYNLTFRWGVLGLGIFTGCTIQKTSDEAAYQSLFLSIPAALHLKYATNFNSPLYGYGEASGGIAVNIFRYQEEYPGVSDDTVIKSFFSPGIGVGYSIMPWLSVSVFGNFLMIFFDDTVYMGISPGVKGEINF